MSKSGKIISGIFASLLALIGIFLLFWYFGDNYTEFYSIARAEFEIAGLKDGFTPQGLCYEQNSDIFLMSGYMKNGTASRIYVVDAETGKTEKYFTLKNGNGDYVGHAGGIETDGTNVWVVGDGFLYRFAFGDIANTETKGEISIIDSFETGNGADYISKFENVVIVGEFHKDGKYDTDESHHIGENKALALCFGIDPTGRCGLTENPLMALSTGSLVQGMTFKGEKIILSTSYSLPKSKIYIYEKPTAASGNFDFNGTQIDLYVLNDSILIDTIEAPCMSEEIAVSEGRVYVLFESACKKYGLVTREPLKNVYSFEID